MLSIRDIVHTTVLPIRLLTNFQKTFYRDRVWSEDRPTARGCETFVACKQIECWSDLLVSEYFMWSKSSWQTIQAAACHQNQLSRRASGALFKYKAGIRDCLSLAGATKPFIWPLPRTVKLALSVDKHSHASHIPGDHWPSVMTAVAAVQVLHMASHHYDASQDASIWDKMDAALEKAARDLAEMANETMSALVAPEDSNSSLGHESAQTTVSHAAEGYTPAPAQQQPVLQESLLSSRSETGSPPTDNRTAADRSLQAQRLADFRRSKKFVSSRQLAHLDAPPSTEQSDSSSLALSPSADSQRFASPIRPLQSAFASYNGPVLSPARSSPPAPALSGRQLQVHIPSAGPDSNTASSPRALALSPSKSPAYSPRTSSASSTVRNAASSPRVSSASSPIKSLPHSPKASTASSPGSFADKGPVPAVKTRLQALKAVAAPPKSPKTKDGLKSPRAMPSSPAAVPTNFNTMPSSPKAAALQKLKASQTWAKPAGPPSNHTWTKPSSPSKPGITAGTQKEDIPASNAVHKGGAGLHQIADLDGPAATMMPAAGVSACMATESACLCAIGTGVAID